MCNNKSKTGHMHVLVRANGYVVNSTLGPRVAAGEAQAAHPDPTEHSVVLNGLHRIGRARRVIATYIAVEGRDNSALAAEDDYTDVARKQPDELQCPPHRLAPL